MNKLRVVLFTSGVVCILFGIFYFVQVVMLSRWDDTPFRTVIILLVLGGLLLIGICQILRNQEKIISLLQSGNAKAAEGGSDE